MQDKLTRMKEGKGFIAALDQSGGSTPKALERYGVDASAYNNEEEMFDCIHAMRSRIIQSPSFSGHKILGAILFEKTMDRTIDGKMSADYLWEGKGILSFLKVDQGLRDEKKGVRMMKTMVGLETLLQRALQRGIFGTKMRSVILSADAEGIHEVVEQQFRYAREILKYNLMPIIEPEVDIHAADKAAAEKILKKELIRFLNLLPEGEQVMLKLTLPSVDDFYEDVMNHPKVLRVVALSGGYSRDEANDLLRKNDGMIASFSRALTEGLHVDQSAEEFDEVLAESVNSIYEASIAPF